MSLGDQLLQLAVSGVALGAVYGIVGLGFTIIYNATGVINFAQGEFVVLGGLVAVSLVAWHVPIPLAAVIASLVVAAVGLLLERLAVRPLVNASMMSMIAATIGASVCLQGAARLIWGPDALSLPAFSGETPLHLGSAAIEPQEVWVAATAVLVFVAVQVFFKYSLTGKAMRACAINRSAARLAGIDVAKMTALAFGLSAWMSGLAGVVLVPLTMVNYDGGPPLAVKGFCAAIIGGLGNGLGAVVGGVFLGVLEAVAAGQISSGYKDAIALLVLLLVLFLRPGGLLGRKVTSEGL